MRNNLLKSFGYAFEGIVELLRKERNFQIHCFALVVVVGAGFFFSITRLEWVIILLVSALVLALEGVNTAIEKLCDLYSTEQHSQIKKIKDIAAGAVLVAAIFAAIIGGIIFLPKLMLFLQ
ncbi:MAG: diacylglycerol kinase family protein [Bacteroidota bacterium]